MLSGERVRDLQAWLRERITVEQAGARYAEMGREIRALLGVESGCLAYFRERVAAGMQPGDELWLYDTGPESWAHHCGERGLTVVRDGRPIKLVLEREN